MASSKRERELARMRAERQAARRAAAAARRRQRNAVIASVVAVLLVAGAGTALALSRRDDNKAGTAAAASATPTTSAAATAAPAGTCIYAKRGTASKKAPLPPAKAPDKGKRVTAVLTTNRGEVDLALDSTKTPCTTNSFTSLARSAYFDGTSCHRLTTSGIFVLQCGDPTGSGSGGPGYAFSDENLTGATYPAGTVAMANAGAGTNGSQFFLVYKGGSQLSPNYTPFGRITKGLDTLAAVAKAGTANGTQDGKPKQGVTLTKVTIKTG